ncbi:TetR/AcrR family transcriptional regulator [Mangrovibrevibacter kandeliae]|uniref:TetR/AcrR family transcriptional regulator n=1 Tax=Mangrovibrevibacter kandeliae TaxID=2968473 RepID=UPI0021191095|nr:TetR/AcrR family transcriptional regulator [Aurantimonas sp. MSK8Z-1]MCQ8783611.1 TetR/AcrR family transcriptional regulator [Aurantimonas sp. CSK15Z-1]MCW4116428.1 TetR/AcrR family transcriptional regulator [Aurantimonas sp. MSK8Z-1]
MSTAASITQARSLAGEDPAKRRQILDGARDVFIQMGFDAASMNDVTRAAGVSKSTLYVYFRSKDELFHALICEERERYFEEIEKMFADTDHPVETLRLYGERLARKLTSNAVVRANRAVIGVAERMPELGAMFYEQGPERAIGMLANYLETATADGKLAVDDPRQAAMQFIELSMAGLFRRRLFGHIEAEPDHQEIVNTVGSALRVFMAAYGPKTKAEEHPTELAALDA